MSEINNHPEWENPYIVAKDESIVRLIRNIRRCKIVTVEQPDAQSGEEDS